MELFKGAIEKTPLLDDILYYRTLSCNPTPKELESCNQYCLLGLLMYFEKSHGLLPYLFHKGSYYCK